MNNELEILTEKIKQFCEDRDWDQFHTPKDLAIGLVTEASELLDIFRFMDDGSCRAFFEDSNKREDIEDEVADIFFFLLRFCQLNDIDLKSSLDRKILKNGKKYPLDKSKGSNKKYSEF